MFKTQSCDRTLSNNINGNQIGKKGNKMTRTRTRNCEGRLEQMGEENGAGVSLQVRSFQNLLLDFSHKLCSDLTSRVSIKNGYWDYQGLAN